MCELSLECFNSCALHSTAQHGMALIPHQVVSIAPSCTHEKCSSSNHTFLLCGTLCGLNAKLITCFYDCCAWPILLDLSVGSVDCCLNCPGVVICVKSIFLIIVRTLENEGLTWLLKVRVLKSFVLHHSPKYTFELDCNTRSGVI